MTIDPAKPGGELVVTVDDPILAEITRRLVETYSPERIYLFGSRARGSAGSDSDYDLLVVVSDDVPPRCGEAPELTRRSGGSQLRARP